MVWNPKLLVVVAFCGLAACGSTGSAQDGYTMQQCRDILATAPKPGTPEDANRRKTERVCANIVASPPGKAGGPASAPRPG